MKLITFEVASPLGRLRRAGVLTPTGAAVDLNLAYAALLASGGSGRAQAIADAVVPEDLLELLRGGPQALDAARAAVDHALRAAGDPAGPTLVHEPGGFRLLAPLPRPNSLRDFLVVEEHLRNARKGEPPPPEWHNMPVYYKGNVDAIFGPDDEIRWPAYTDRLDYELEMGAVIGRPAFQVKADDAAEHIVGYTIFNDWSARDIQRREMSVGLGPAVGKDFASSIGPCIVTSDEFNPATAVMRARIDGEVWSEGTVGPMLFSFPEIIEWVSSEQRLLPGDILGSGTVGRGCGLELDRWIQPGSIVELEVEGIGILRNRVGRRTAGETIENARSARASLQLEDAR
jgi:2-keto-4-pentenoate hydratase/2-oxohepta-3-ene-1,7-dioic acid hydratase in catechol pathway